MEKNKKINIVISEIGNTVYTFIGSEEGAGAHFERMDRKEALKFAGLFLELGYEISIKSGLTYQSVLDLEEKLEIMKQEKKAAK